MKSLSLYQEFDISVYEADTWELPTHRHNFFELVFILEGNGTHIFNDNGTGYKKGSLFFLTPEDHHSFEIKDRTGFCIITFTRIYFSRESGSKDNLLDFSELFKNLEIIFYNASYLRNEPIRNEEDNHFIEILIKKLITEMTEKRLFYTTIIQNSVFLLLNIIARNIHLNLSADFKHQKPKSEIGDMLIYIQQNIYKKEKLSIEAIASHFYKSKNYISQYFKSETGESLKDYISKFKINLAKNRLQLSNLTISQIADELEYTDESHLNKTFKLFFGQTAKQYRSGQYDKTIIQ
jgi:AraC family transcriptional regulator, L-rhamnose operon regulatory protein RhaS